jgi:hypothetical protein
MNELLSTANISCAASKNCNYQSQILVQAPLYKYSRQVMYSESLGEIAVPEITTQAQQMIQEQEAIFGQAGWQTQQEDYTQTERGWNSSSILSLRLHARNDLHQCLQTITFTSKTTNDVTMRKIVECRVMPQIIGAIE